MLPDTSETCVCMISTSKFLLMVRVNITFADAVAQHDHV